MVGCLHKWGKHSQQNALQHPDHFGRWTHSLITTVTSVAKTTPRYTPPVRPRHASLCGSVLYKPPISDFNFIQSASLNTPSWRPDSVITLFWTTEARQKDEICLSCRYPDAFPRRSRVQVSPPGALSDGAEARQQVSSKMACRCLSFP